MDAGRVMPFVLSSLLVASLFSFFLLYSHNPLTIVPDQVSDTVKNLSQNQNVHSQTQKVLSKPQKGMFQNDPVIFVHSICFYFYLYYIESMMHKSTSQS